MTDKRIWELDALRGVCILGMVAVHFLYDLRSLLPLPPWPLFSFIQNWGGAAFVVLSGICVTLGSRCLRRGALVFACGMLCTAVTWGLYRLGLAGKELVILFGVLHCLGTCMAAWVLFSRLSTWGLVLTGTVLAAAGLLAARCAVPTPWLLWLGLTPPNFASGDYFPLLPNLGFFLLGAALGRRVYRHRRTLFPGTDPQRLPVRLLCCCGRHSLLIYLLHQPILAALLWIWASLAF